MMTKDKKYHLIIITQAVILGVIFHVLLLLLFKQQGGAQAARNHTARHISLLPPAKAHAIYTWLNYSDPTLIAKPNERLGYGVLTGRNGLRRYTHSVALPYESRKVTFMESKAISPLAEIKKVKQLSGQVPPLRYAESSATGVDVYFPLVVAGRGGALPYLFAGTDDIAERLKRGKPSGSTVVTMEKNILPEVMPRCRVVQSCGAGELDRLGVRVLMASDEVAGLLANSRDRILHLEIIWSGKGGSRKQ